MTEESGGAESVLAESPVVLAGLVVGPDGSPVEGAVVASSAGGEARSDARGGFRLEVRMPTDAEILQVTAVGPTAGAKLRASAQVPIRGSSPAYSGPVVLALEGTCQPSWEPTFGGQPGTGALNSPGIRVRCFATFDDGGGPALYVAGSFPTVGGMEAHDLARWDGSSWSALSTGLSDIWALVEFDDGSGPALYAGGLFQFDPGPGFAAHVARWDGSSWSALGNGTNGFVYALAVFDDGSGPALYAGGYFTTAGGMAAQGIAKWDGTSWSPLGSGMLSVNALAVHDDGSGPALYAGGNFTTAGGVPANWIARWDGSIWSALGSGMNLTVRSLAVFDDGGGPALYAGGEFTTAGGGAANRIAKWDGASWTPLAGGLDDYPSALAAFDDGSGPALYAGGRFTEADGALVNRIARWDGASWSALQGGMSNAFATSARVDALAVFDAGGGPLLYVGGIFTAAGSVPASRIATWDGAAWSATSDGINDRVGALAIFDDGGGPALYAGGRLTGAGGVPIPRIGKWDGTSWSALGSGIELGEVQALAVFDDGGGPALFAAGSFTSAGGFPANRIAKWDGSSWSPLAGGLDGVASALAVFDDGSGPALYAGGLFAHADGVLVNCIARWDGSSWSALGLGVSDGVGETSVDALAVFDDGGGPALYAAGEFRDAGGVSVRRIAMWRSGAWSPLIQQGGGTTDTIHALTVFDDGSGPALYVGGLFLRGGGIDLIHIGKFDGSSWSPLGSGTSDDVRSLAVFDDGSGPALYAGGEFHTAGGVAARRIARWDGSSWSALGSGIGSAFTGVSSPGPDVAAMVVFDDGCGSSLYVGGAFESVSDSHDSFLARWRGCLDTIPPVLSCPTEVFVVDDRSDPPGEIVVFQVTASDACHPDPPVICAPPSGSFFPRGTTTVTCTATDEAGNQTSCSFPVVVSLPPRVRVR